MSGVGFGVGSGVGFMWGGGAVPCQKLHASASSERDNCVFDVACGVWRLTCSSSEPVLL